MTGAATTAAAAATARPSSPFRQPKAVYAVAFACVVSFMGIGWRGPFFGVAALMSIAILTTARGALAVAERAQAGTPPAPS